MPRARLLLVLGVAGLLLATVAISFADFGAAGPGDAAGCGDWWCAERNSLPLGLAILFGGAGVALIGAGLIHEDPRPRPPHSELERPERPRRP